ncbi:cytochrome P450 [Burkholderia sp. FERM BP-3421]|jgi:cytochrome P450|uniref:cytochrome P450 n=1 Tax=Burkholderia sp. FERM BP-3421 TaxID=1494466 RepID=UPI00236282BB|nr:cytochrome P450 [Burkholderia sp. FERM BP-3421]WDD95773.1 cytochrome P450 [Burkholderia sp. FERM BP-3421]
MSLVANGLDSVAPPAARPPALLFNPNDPQFNQNPYPHYARLRNEDPVHRSPIGVWFLSKYAHVRGTLKDRRFNTPDIPGQLRKKNEILKTRRISPTQPANIDSLVSNAEKWFVFLDGAEHMRLRNLVSAAFQRRQAETMRAQIRAEANALLDRLNGQPTVDLMVDYAAKLPQHVIANVLGLPREDFERCASWATAMGRLFDPLVSFDEYAVLNESSIAFLDYLRELVAQRRAEPRDDLISALIEARDEGDRLSESELLSIIIFNFGAGEETVASLIGNGCLALLQHPEQMRRLRDDPALMPSAVEEMLRYDPPLQMTSRYANEDLEIEGRQIAKGDQVYVILGSANRDPEQFPDPDAFDVGRERSHHMAFADGHHYCVGAQLARIEAQEGFAALLERYPSLSLSEQSLSYRSHTVLRSLTHLYARTI